MQLHQIKSNHPRPDRKRVGRGGKRGTYSGKGQKGQKARSPIKPDFRGGNAPIWKLFPKQRGASKKTKIKHRYFIYRRSKAVPVGLGKIDLLFKEGEKVNAQTLAEKGAVDSPKRKIKILSNGDLKKKLEFEGLPLSKEAQKKIIQSGGTIK